MANDKGKETEDVVFIDGPSPPTFQVKGVPSFYQYFEITTKLTIVQ